MLGIRDSNFIAVCHKQHWISTGWRRIPGKSEAPRARRFEIAPGRSDLRRDTHRLAYLGSTRWHGYVQTGTQKPVNGGPSWVVLLTRRNCGAMALTLPRRFASFD